MYKASVLHCSGPDIGWSNAGAACVGFVFVQCGHIFGWYCSCLSQLHTVSLSEKNSLRKVHCKACGLAWLCARWFFDEVRQRLILTGLNPCGIAIRFPIAPLGGKKVAMALIHTYFSLSSTPLCPHRHLCIHNFLPLCPSCLPAFQLLSIDSGICFCGSSNHIPLCVLHVWFFSCSSISI